MGNKLIGKIKICPRCGKPYSGEPAISRSDNKTEICSDCGIHEALDSIGVPSDEQEKIIALVHKHAAEYED